MFAPHGLLGVVAVFGVSACATASADVGYLVPVSGDEGYETWMVEARAATGGIVKLGVAARSKLGERRDSIALAPELSIEMSPSPVTVGVRLGVHLAQFDSEDGEWNFGAGTPYLQPILQFRVGDPVFLFLGGSIEYDLNAGDGPDQTYIGAHLGLGLEL